MINQFDGTHGNERKDIGSAPVAWVKPTLEKLSLKDALSAGTISNDGTTGGPGHITTFS